MSSVSEKSVDVLAIGHALVDVLAYADESFLEAEGLVKGSMQLITDERARYLYNRMGPATEASGGSAANTATGVVACGGSAEFVGTVAFDQLGEIFAHDIKAAGVRFRVPPVPTATTGRSLILVTPDGERTMNTLIGAAENVSLAKIDRQTLETASITFAEGYLFDSQFSLEDWREIASAVHSGGGKLAVTLSDTFCVERHREMFLALLDESIDICLGNEHEFKKLFEASTTDECLEMLAKRCSGAVTLGAEGSIVVSGTERVHIPVQPVDVVDATGAGDLYAAGFLAGIAQGKSPEQCGQLATKAAAAVLSQMGARLNEDAMLGAG